MSEQLPVFSVTSCPMAWAEKGSNLKVNVREVDGVRVTEVRVFTEADYPGVKAVALAGGSVDELIRLLQESKAGGARDDE